ncbi:hypothetical protein [Rhizobium sp. K102]|uniref:hypothetical protein n=1 Tax=Rhizobium sp. K102 TaxID=2918527 RepID=UPI001EFA775D|nr:hypothetical protein [Rhizobium sp. K102]ULR44862.1 hypothetical protein MHI61_06385 [Rhizobium sp. K102]
MRVKLTCAALAAFGMATGAFAQSSTTTGTSTDSSITGTRSGGGTQTMQPMTTDPSSTGSTFNGSMGSTLPGGCSGGSAPANSTASGSVQTQGGLSDATPQGEACSQ